jgi:hypothetical protein
MISTEAKKLAQDAAEDPDLLTEIIKNPVTVASRYELPANEVQGIKNYASNHKITTNKPNAAKSYHLET